MKKTVLFLSLVLILLIGCSNKKADEAAAAESAKYEEYTVMFMNVMDQSNSLLTSYSNYLDDLYTRKSSDSEFGQTVRTLIEPSSEILTKLDEHLYSLEGELGEFHRELIALVTRQHRLFRDSVDQALQEEKRSMDKEHFHDEYLAIKQQQTVLVEKLKQITLSPQQ